MTALMPRRLDADPLGPSRSARAGADPHDAGEDDQAQTEPDDLPRRPALVEFVPQVSGLRSCARVRAGSVRLGIRAGLKWRTAIDTHDMAASQRAFESDRPDDAASRIEVSRRAMGKLIGAAASGALGGGAFGALPAAAAESKASSQTTYRLFPHTNGPSTPAAYTGSFLAGVAFEVTTGGCWLEGFWWWVCHSHQSTKAQKFALWQAYHLVDGNLIGKLIEGGTAQAKQLHAGRWNYIPLPKPVPLSIGATYVAATGLKNSFPITKHSFGKGEKYGKGIKSGPLLAYSDQGGTRPVPFGASQALYSVAGDDPTKKMPGLGDGQHSNFWMDLQITTKAPKGTSYRLWPSFPVLPAPANAPVTLDTVEQSMGTEFWLSARCKLDKIWFYSPPGAAILPSQCAIWTVGSVPSMVAGTLKTSPGWSGKAGSGWVSASYSGITLPAGKYKTSVYSPGGQPFFAETAFYFGEDIDNSTPGTASPAGISTGPLYSPNVAKASLAEANGSLPSVPAGTLVPSNSTYQDNTSEQAGEFLFPYSFDSKDNGENRWVDVEVTPA